MKTTVVLFAIIASVYSSAIAPTFEATRDTVFQLSTRQNRGNPHRLLFHDLANLDASPYNPAKPLRVLVHGWREGDTSDINVGTSEELLNYYDFNVIFVDWSLGAQTINYAAAANRVEGVGALLAAQLNFMRENGRLDFNRVYIIGFSLGAHIAGFAGKHTNSQLHTIIGLDPAGPLFQERNPDGRIDAGDAQYVECHHTNGAGLFNPGAGIGAHICQADFFPNGGEDQPGCGWSDSCSHARAVQYYIESIQFNGFHSTRCASVREANRENCNGESGIWPSGEPSNHNIALRGIFHHRTRNNSPFALGPFRP